MKILFATDNYYPHVSGTPIFTWRLAYNLKKRGSQTLVIAPSRKISHEFYNHKGVDVFGIRSIPTLVYNGFRISPPFFIKQQIKKIIKDFKPDIVHLQDHFFIGRTVLKIAKQLGVPTIGTNSFMPENLLHYFPFPKMLEPLLYQFAWKQFCSVYEKLDLIETPTKTAAHFLKRLGFSKPIHFISHGIDLKRFNPKNNGDYLKKRYAIPNKPILLYVGRIDKEKHIDVILKAMLLILKKIDAHFVIAGNGAEIEYLKKLVKNLDIGKNVTFTGPVPDEDLPNLYCIANCFIIASIAELQSFVTMEAMASSLPIVAANAMALPELVLNDENGYLFEPNDVKRIAKCVAKILSNKSIQRRMAKKSLEIISLHDFENTLIQFESLYKSLL